jgi:hypothetical protein
VRTSLLDVKSTLAVVKRDAPRSHGAHAVQVAYILSVLTRHPCRNVQKHIPHLQLQLPRFKHQQLPKLPGFQLP